MEEKNVNEGLIPIDDTKKEVTEVKEKEVAEKNASVKEIELEEEAKHGEDLTEAMISVNEKKEEEKELLVDKREEMQRSGHTEKVEEEKVATIDKREEAVLTVDEIEDDQSRVESIIDKKECLFGKRLASVCSVSGIFRG